MNRTTLQVVAALYGQGVKLVFGHDWRDDGIMSAIHGFAQQMQTQSASSANVEVQERAALTNLLPWGDTPYLHQDELAQLAPTLMVELLPAPEPVRLAREFPGTLGDEIRRAIALRDLRERLNDEIDVRVCFGGRLVGYQGFLPGVIEEASRAAQAKKPLFLCGLLGGATMKLIGSVQGRDNSRLGAELELEQKMQALPESAREYVADIYGTLANLDEKRLSDLNHLSIDENRELFDTCSVDRAIELILRGLAKLVDT